MNTNVEDYVEEAKSRMPDKMKDKLQDVKERMTDTAQRVSDKARDVSQTTNRYVNENPWKALGMVALAACLLGWFLRSASED